MDYNNPKEIEDQKEELKYKIINIIIKRISRIKTFKEANTLAKTILSNIHPSQIKTLSVNWNQFDTNKKFLITMSLFGVENAGASLVIIDALKEEESKKEDIVLALLDKTNLDYNIAVEKVEDVLKVIDEQQLYDLSELWNTYDSGEKQYVALNTFGRLRLSDGILVLESISKPSTVSKENQQGDGVNTAVQEWKNVVNKEVQKQEELKEGEGQMASDKLEIKIEPKLQLPQDENGKSYLGLYVGVKEINRIYVDEDFNLLGTKTDEIVSELKDIKKVILAANGVDDDNLG